MTFLIRYWFREPFARNGTCFGHLFLFWVPEAHSPLQEWGLEAFGMSPCLVEVALDSPFWRTEVRRRLRAFFIHSPLLYFPTWGQQSYQSFSQLADTSQWNFLR